MIFNDNQAKFGIMKNCIILPKIFEKSFLKVKPLMILPKVWKQSMSCNVYEVSQLWYVTTWFVTDHNYSLSSSKTSYYISKKYSLANQSFLKMTTDAKKENFGGDSNLFLLLNVTVVETWNRLNCKSRLFNKLDSFLNYFM